MSSPAVEVGMSKRQYTCTVHWCCVHSPLTGFPQLCARRHSGGVPGFQEWFCILQKGLNGLPVYKGAQVVSEKWWKTKAANTGCMLTCWATQQCYLSFSLLPWQSPWNSFSTVHVVWFSPFEIPHPFLCTHTTHACTHVHRWSSLRHGPKLQASSAWRGRSGEIWYAVKWKPILPCFDSLAAAGTYEAISLWMLLAWSTV